MRQLLSSYSDLEVDWRSFKFFIILKPALNLPKTVKFALLPSLAKAINLGFGTQRRPEDIANHVYENDLLMIVTDVNGCIIAFASFLDFETIKTLYLFGTTVVPQLQGMGIGYQMVSLVLKWEDNKHVYVTTRTQNPALYVLLSKLAKEIYPRPNVRPPSKVIAVARDIAHFNKMDDFDSLSMIGRKTYGGLMTGDEIIYGGQSSAGSDFLHLGINAKEGDCLIVVGRLSGG